MKKRSKTESVRRIVKMAMARNGIEYQEELGAMICMKPKAIGNRLSGSTKWTLFDFWMLDKVLKFTDEEWLAILRC